MKRLLAIALVACGGAPATPTPLPVSDQPVVAPPPAPVAKAKAIAQPKLVETALPNDPMKVTIHRLSNGMTVYISPDATEPNVVTRIAVHAGGSSDPESSTGLAHYLEHMLFKGTTKFGTLDYGKEQAHLDKIAQLYADLRKPNAERDKILKAIDDETQATAEIAIPNELDQLYTRLGVKGLNAFTNNDSTVYVSTVPKNRLAQWARVEAARYSDAVFRLFWPELEAVYEEKNIGLDNPDRRVNEALMKAMFPHHGYGWSSVIGEVEHLKSPAYGDMVDFFHRYYTPQNMAILLSGDVDDSVLPLLEKEFGSFKRPAGDLPDQGQQPSIKGRQQVDVTVPSREGVILAWPLVALTHPDRLALEVMDAIFLDVGDGLLKRDLILPHKVANTYSQFEFLRDAGIWQLAADSLTDQSRDDLEKLLLAVVTKVKNGEFSEEDLRGAALSREIQLQQAHESNSGRIGQMTEAFIGGIEWRDQIEELERVRKITKADVVRVANKYLTSNFLAVEKIKGTITPPKITKPGITAVKVDPTRQSAFAKSILDMPVTPIEPVTLKEGADYERGTMWTGELVSVHNTRNSLFSITYEFDVGRSDDRLVCDALEILKVSGAGKLSPAAVTTQLYRLGVTVTTICNRDRSSILVSGVDRNMEAGLALLRDWIADPAFDDAIVKGAVKVALTQRTNKIADPRVVGTAATVYAQFGQDSEFLVVPSNKQLESATVPQLKKLIQAYGHYKHRTSYFGPRRTPDAIKTAVFGDGKVATTPRKALKYRHSDAVVGVDQQTAQTRVQMFWPKRATTDVERAAGSLFSAYIGPTIFQQVREARGLAYSVGAWYAASPRKSDEASVNAFVGTQGDKTHEAIDAVLTTLHDSIDDTRLATAKEGVIESYRAGRIPPRAVAASVYSWDDQGERTDPRAKRTEQVLKLDKAALERWIKANLGNQYTISVTGDRKKLDEARLKKIAPVTFVPVDKLFGY